MEYSHWDGRPPFYPPLGYEMDADHHAMYLEFCENQGLGHLFDNPDNVADGDEEANNGEHGFILPLKTIYSPPLYDKQDHYHELFEEDEKYRLFNTSPSGRRLHSQLRSNQRDMSLEKWSSKISKKSTEMILKNRNETSSIKVAWKGLVVMNARITGLKVGAPTRRIEVPGKIPLSTLHDRVLCPAFGWTKGYHDYRFLVPPSGYRDSPPRIPMLDVVFGAQSTDSLMVPSAKQGFYGTLRNGSNGAPTVCDNSVCVADLLNLPGHRLWHVLGQPGWKTELTVEKIDTNRGAVRPMVVGGQVGSLPEAFVLELDLSTGCCIHEFDCRGPHAFALAHEIMKRGNQSNEAAWMKRHILNNRAAKESDFNIYRPFDLDAAKGRLIKALNPEYYSTDWMRDLLGESPMTNNSAKRDLQRNVCNFCCRAGDRLKTKMRHCQRCKSVSYCCRECQIKDWKTHKKVCYDETELERAQIVLQLLK